MLEKSQVIQKNSAVLNSFPGESPRQRSLIVKTHSKNDTNPVPEPLPAKYLTSALHQQIPEEEKIMA